MKKTKKQFGKKSEAMAAAYLTANGYTIITTNWHCPQGEIDIIAHKDGVLVFVEVRARHSHTTETAFASIDVRKQKKLYETALTYLSENGLENVEWRIDVIAIAVPRSGDAIIQQVQNALDW